MQMPDGTLAPRDERTPLGRSDSPLLTNPFMHYALIGEWTGSSPARLLNVTRMTWSSTATLRHRPEACGRHSLNGTGRWDLSCTRHDEGRVL